MNQSQIARTETQARFNDHSLVFRAQRLQGLPAWVYISGRDGVLDTGRPACFASRATRKYRGKNTQKMGISQLYCPQLGCPLSWPLPRSPINIGKEKKITNNHIDCTALSYSVSRDTCFLGDTSGLWVQGGGEGGRDFSAFSYYQTWQFPT